MSTQRSKGGLLTNTPAPRASVGQTAPGSPTGALGEPPAGQDPLLSVVTAPTCTVGAFLSCSLSPPHPHASQAFGASSASSWGLMLPEMQRPTRVTEAVSGGSSLCFTQGFCWAPSAPPDGAANWPREPEPRLEGHRRKEDLGDRAGLCT